MYTLYRGLYPKEFYLLHQCVRLNLSIKTVLQSNMIRNSIFGPKKGKFHFVCSITLKNNSSKFLQPYFFFIILNILMARAYPENVTGK